MTQQPPPRSPQPPESSRSEGMPPEGTQPDSTPPVPAAPGPRAQQSAPQPSWPAQPPEDGSQHTAPLWYEQTQLQPQYPPYSPGVQQTAAEPGNATLTEPGARPAQ